MYIQHITECCKVPLVGGGKGGGSGGHFWNWTSDCLHVIKGILLNSDSNTSGYMSHIMRKPVYAICRQQRRRSACASTQSDSAFVVHCLDSIVALVSISKISSLYLASVAAQAGLSLPWSQTPKDRYSCDRAHMFLKYVCVERWSSIVQKWSQSSCIQRNGYISWAVRLQNIIRAYISCY